MITDDRWSDQAGCRNCKTWRPPGKPLSPKRGAAVSVYPGCRESALDDKIAAAAVRIGVGGSPCLSGGRLEGGSGPRYAETGIVAGTMVPQPRRLSLVRV